MTASPPNQDDWQAAQLRRLYRGIFHEASNPLGGALGCLQAVQEELCEAEELPTYLDAVQDGLRRVQRLIAAFHRFVLPRETVSRPVDLKSAVDDACLLIKKDAAEARITLERTAASATVHGGPVSCLQVAVQCLQGLVDGQRETSSLRAEIIEMDSATRLIMTGTLRDEAYTFPAARIEAVEAICAAHGATVTWALAENRVAIDWQRWSR